MYDRPGGGTQSSMHCSGKNMYRTGDSPTIYRVHGIVISGPRPRPQTAFDHTQCGRNTVELKNSSIRGRFPSSQCVPVRRLMRKLWKLRAVFRVAAFRYAFASRALFDVNRSAICSAHGKDSHRQSTPSFAHETFRKLGKIICSSVTGRASRRDVSTLSRHQRF